MAGELPAEVIARPLTYVAVYGLNVDSNPSHGAIWNVLALNRKPERAPLNLGLHPLDHQYLTPKPKRTSYEWYVPKGILKTNWLPKHLYQLPAVAVLFYDLDWDSPQWSEKRVHCQQQLETVRASLQNRATRVALVLVQKKVPIPGGDDLSAKERAAALCSACDLSSKFLFVLPVNDHLEGYILRLENAFFELALTYFHQEIKFLKNHKDLLNKTTHQVLFVRHQFKIGFYSELKQDLPSALKHYKQAYSNLMEVRASDTNMMEVKTVAAIINYKICHLYFVTNVPLDAISQFRNHIDIFKNKTGPKELLFEHYDWLGMQFLHFGNLFNEAVRMGLSAIQTQHPGFYYQQAAAHAAARKAHALSLSLPPTSEVQPELLQGPLEYYGQRPWRPASQNLDLPDQAREATAIATLQHRELTQVNHSEIIIHFLEKAIIQFHLYRSPRMRRHLKIQMAEEYLFCKKYLPALENFKEVLWEMKTERWKEITSSILHNAIKASFLAARIEDFLVLGLEFISEWNQATLEEKIIVQTGITQILKGQVPGLVPGISEDEANESLRHWEANLAATPQPLMLSTPIASIAPFLECNVGFTQSSVTCDQKLVLRVQIKINAPQPMKFTQFSVLLNNRAYEQFCSQSLGEMFFPHKDYTFQCTFYPDLQDVNQHLTVQGLTLLLGSSSLTSLVLQYQILPSSDTKSLPSSVSILPRQAHLSITPAHFPPLLLNELYPITVTILNEEPQSIHDVTLSLVSSSPTNGTVEFLDSDLKVLNAVPLGSLNSQEKVDCVVYARTSKTGLHRVELQANYEVEIELDGKAVHCKCSRLVPLDIPAIEPLSFSFTYLNTKFEVVKEVKVGLPFIVKAQFLSQTKIPIILEKGSLFLDPPFRVQESKNNIESVVLKEGFGGAELFLCTVDKAIDESTVPGDFSLNWHRQGEVAAATTTLHRLPKIGVAWSPLAVCLDAPSHGWVRTPLPVTYHLANNTSQVQDVEIHVDGSDAFMFAGNRLLNLRLLPGENHAVNYNLYPLVAGFVPLPRLTVVLNSGVATRPLPLDDCLPSCMFILPQGKPDPTFQR